MPVGEKKLYKLIWETTIESCMANCIYNLLTIEISAPNKFLYKKFKNHVSCCIDYYRSRIICQI